MARAASAPGMGLKTEMVELRQIKVMARRMNWEKEDVEGRILIEGDSDGPLQKRCGCAVSKGMTEACRKGRDGGGKVG